MVYKVVIIDDERVIREGLKKIVPWSEFCCEVVGESENGNEGLELIKECNPDIIITDIRMQSCDGLTMIERVVKTSSHAKIIILTGYRDFGYVQKALKLGAFDYLLKPTDVDMFKACLKKAVEELEKEAIADDSIIDEIILGTLANQPHIIAMNMIKTRLMDSLYKGNKEAIRSIYEEYLQLLDSKIEEDKVKKVALYQLAKGLSAVRGKLRHVDYTPLLGLKRLLVSDNDIASIQELIWEAIENVLDDVMETSDDSKNSKINQMKNFISNNYNKPISVKDIADNLYISTYYASKIFKKETGINLIEYLNYYRIEKAKEFLGDLSYKVYEIADLVGISDSHYFSRIFKKSTGCTPKEYRDLCVKRENDEI